MTAERAMQMPKNLFVFMGSEKKSQPLVRMQHVFRCPTFRQAMRATVHEEIQRMSDLLEAYAQCCRSVGSCDR